MSEMELWVATYTFRSFLARTNLAVPDSVSNETELYVSVVLGSCEA